MARWKLTAGHYLNVVMDPPIEVEFKETNRETGRQARKVYPVPLLMNPDDAADHNYPGEIIVCQPGKGERRDIVFLGDPTPDMEPLDDEAREISASFASKWAHPIDSLPANGDYGAALTAKFEKQISQVMAGQAPLPNTGVDPKAFAEMQEQLKALMAQNAELMAKVEAKPTRRA